MNKLTPDEARFIRRWLYIEEDTDRDIFLRAFKMKEDYKIFYYIFIATLLVMLGNYFGMEEIGERFLR